MHGPLLATLLVGATLGLARPEPADASDAADEARRRLARDDGASAVSVLEDALPGAGAGPAREAILDLLRRAYELAATQADSAGRPRDAATYRENLRILNRKPRPAAAPANAPAPAPEPPSPIVEPMPHPSAGPTMLPEAPEPRPAEPEPTPTTRDRPVDPPAPTGPAALLPMPAEAPEPDIAAADAAFSAKDYAGAGRIYAALARDHKLPAERRDHWAYCRSAAVVDRINARPQAEAEWASIDAEIDQIRALNPNNWLGEYLRNRASERLTARKKPRPGRTVVRASSPEEPAAIDRPVRPASAPPPAEPPKAPAATVRTGAVGRWQVKDTANFRIYHVDPALAEKVATAAEATRRDQTRRWTGALPRGPWQPQCEIYLYPTAAQYAQMTGQPEDSPGFSTMGMNSGRIISRRVNLRADHPTLVQAVLPHEVTHVILADVFPTQQIPRWADEGLAVLSEPADEQARRAADLAAPLTANRLFPMDALMGMDYPDNQYWALYYAQSVSLTRFLVEQGTPAQMIQFLQGSQKNGYEAELRRVYKIDGFADLQGRWLVYARATTPTRTAEAPASGPDLKVR